MSSISTLILFLALIMVSLLVVSAINQRQTRRRLIARKLLELKRRTTELDELASMIDSVVESPQIAGIVNDEAIDTIHAMLRLDPNSQALQVLLHSMQEKAHEFENLGRSREIYRLRESDAAIARTLYELNETGRILRRRQSAGKLEMAELETYIRDLAWSHLLVGVVSNVGQGQKCLERGDILRAHAFFKKAQQVAIKTSSTDERRHRLIKEATDLMNNRSKMLSQEFMPELKPEMRASLNAKSTPPPESITE